jgi:hypothetical protein
VLNNATEPMTESDAGFRMADLLLTPGDSLAYEDFIAFCDKRKRGLLQRLRANVVMTDELAPAIETMDDIDEPESVEPMAG